MFYNLNNTSDSPVEFYTHHSLMTDPADYANLFSELPDGISALCEVVQGLVIHELWADRYGYSIPTERAEEFRIRRVADKLKRILELDDRPLVEPRPLDRRIVGNCRDYALLLTAMLRHQGIPARVRCGFGAYFDKNFNVDHYVAEYWKAEDSAWVFLDAQLDEFQRDVLEISFDPCDVPRDQFLPGGVAWQLCQNGEADPNSFGWSNLKGYGYIREQLVRDMAMLNKVEVSGWDHWGLTAGADAGLSEGDLNLLNQAASLSLARNEDFLKIRALYIEDMRLRVPPIVMSYQSQGGPKLEDILEGNPSHAKYL